MKLIIRFRVGIVLFVLAAVLHSCIGNNAESSGLKSLRILLIGDSNTEIGNITMPLKSLIDSIYGNYGTGYITLNTNSMGRVPDSLTVECDKNWTMFDMRNNFKPEQSPYYSPDGLSISSDTPEAELTVQFRGNGMDLFYLEKPVGGRFLITIDGKIKSTIDQRASIFSAKKISYNNMPEGKHIMAVKVLSGVVTLLGVDAKRGDVKDSERFILHKWANAWASTLEFAEIEPDIFATSLKELCPDNVVILLGTNDHNLDHRDAESVKQNLKKIILRIKEALPDCKVMVVSTFTTEGDAAKKSLPGYVATSFPEAARETGSKYWDMNSWFGEYTPGKLPDEGVHVSEACGKKIASQLLRQLTNENLQSTEFDDYKLTHQLTP